MPLPGVHSTIRVLAWPQPAPGLHSEAKDKRVKEEQGRMSI